MRLLGGAPHILFIPLQEIKSLNISFSTGRMSTGMGYSRERRGCWCRCRRWSSRSAWWCASTARTLQIWLHHVNTVVMKNPTLHSSQFPHSTPCQYLSLVMGHHILPMTWLQKFLHLFWPFQECLYFLGPSFSSSWRRLRLGTHWQLISSRWWWCW